MVTMSLGPSKQRIRDPISWDRRTQGLRQPLWRRPSSRPEAVPRVLLAPSISDGFPPCPVRRAPTQRARGSPQTSPRRCAARGGGGELRFKRLIFWQEQFVGPKTEATLPPLLGVHTRLTRGRTYKPFALTLILVDGRTQASNRGTLTTFDLNVAWVNTCNECVDHHSAGSFRTHCAWCKIMITQIAARSPRGASSLRAPWSSACVARTLRPARSNRSAPR